MGREELSRAREQELHGLRLELKRQIASTPPGTARHAALVQQLEGLAPEQVEPIERFAFYERIAGASLIVQSGEASAFGNAILCKGVILP